MQAIDPDDRTSWDVLCIVAVLLSAFEIPYSILVGYQSSAVERNVEIAFSVVFMIDIVLNGLTARESNRYGFWGWRRIAGVFSTRLGRRRLKPGERGQLSTVSRTAAGYLTSGWFPVDTLATIPWGMLTQGASVLSMARALRLMRFARLFRLFRLLKMLRFVKKLRSAMPSLPSLQFMLASLLLIPWLAHVHACVMFFAEQKNPGSEVTTYGKALDAVFVTFTTSDKATATTALGYWVSVSAVVFSVLVISSITGTLAAAFTELNVKSNGRKRTNWSDHTIILGWQAEICLPILQQLATSDERGKPGRAMLIADAREDVLLREIAESDKKINTALLDIVEAEPGSKEILRVANLWHSRQVIAVGSSEDTLLSDAYLLRELLAIGAVLNESAPAKRIPVIVAVHRAASRDVLQHGVPEEFRRNMRFHAISVTDMAALCLAHVVACPQLAPVFEELMAYDSDDQNRGVNEIYRVPVDGRCVGATYDECCSAYQTALPIGYMSGSQVALNPAPHSTYRLRSGDSMILIAENRAAARPSKGSKSSDRSSSEPALRRRHDKSHLPARQSTEGECSADVARDVLVIGGAAGDGFAALLERVLPSGSHVHSIPDPAFSEDADDEEGCRTSFARADTIVVLSGQTDRKAHDADVLMKLSRLVVGERLQSDSVNIVVSLLDADNADTIRAFDAPVAVAGTQMICNLVAQLAESPERIAIFGELLSPDGNSLCTRRASRYYRDGEEPDALSFGCLYRRARGHQETAIGIVPDMTGEPILCAANHGRRVRDCDGVIVIAPRLKQAGQENAKTAGGEA